MPLSIGALIGGIVTAVESAGAAVAGTVAGAAEALGASAGLAGAIGTGVVGAGGGALVGAGLGAGEAALTHGNIGKGAEFGALTGGAIGGLGPAIGAVTGLGTTVGDVAAGLGAGALGGEVTGQSPVTGALMGGAGGLATGLLSGTLASATSAGGAGGGPSSAAAAAAPASVAPSGGDVTAGIGTVGAGGPSNLPTFAQPAGALTTDTGALGAAAGPTTVSALDTTAPAATVGGAAAPASSLAPTTSLAPTASAAAPAAAGGLGGITGGLGKLATNPGVLLGAGVLGYDLLKGNQQPPNYSTLEAEAGNLSQEGRQLQSYEAGGTLPPGLQAGVSAAAESARAAVRSEYAARGMTGSSAEEQDLAAVGQQAETQSAGIAQNLWTQGASAINASDQLYASLMEVSIQQDTQMSNAIANFAGALAGAGLKLPATTTPATTAVA